MKLILERWRLYENQALKDEIERDFRTFLISWVSNYRPGSTEGKKLEAWFDSNKKPQFSKFSYDQIYRIMAEALELTPIIPLESGEELFPGVVKYPENSQGIAAYGAPPQKSPYDKQRFGIFVINNKNWKQSNTGKKKDIVNHEFNHWLDWFKGFIGANTKFASEDNTDLNLLKTIFLDRPVNGHGLNQEQLQYFGSKKEQRAYLKQYVRSNLSEEDISNICIAQQEIVASGGFPGLTQGQYDRILSQANFRPELIVYFNCSEASQQQVIDAARQLVKVDRGRRTMVAEQETPANPKKKKKYLDSHRYMEPDGLQEEWSKSERDKRKSKCANPKGFTMKQFCKNQRTRSKKGQKTN